MNGCVGRMRRRVETRAAPSGPSKEARMRRRRRRSWLLPLTFCAGVLAGRDGSAQDRPAPPPPAPDDRTPTPFPLPPPLLPLAPTAGTPAATLSSMLIPPAPRRSPARRARACLAAGGAPDPQGPADQPGDRAATGGGPPARHRRCDRAGPAGAGAASPGQGAVDPQPQRRRRLLPARRRPAEHLHRRELPQGAAVVLRRRRSVPVGRAHRRDLRPAGGAAGGRVARGGSPGGAERRAAPGLAGVLRPPGGPRAAAGHRRVDRRAPSSW